MAQQWFYARGGRKTGPVTSRELRALAAAGALRPDDLVWIDGDDRGRQAGQIKGLFTPVEAGASPPGAGGTAGSSRPDGRVDPSLDPDRLRDRLSRHAGAVPHHGIADLGSEIEVRGACRIPIHRIAWTSLFERRQVVERQAPHDGTRAYPPPKYRRQNLDAWSLSLPSPGDFADGSSELPVEGSEAVEGCGQCRSIGHVTCDGCRGQKVVACGQCAGGGLVRCGTCSGTGQTYQVRSEQRTRVCGNAGVLTKFNGTGYNCRGGRDERGNVCRRCNGTGVEYYSHQERYPVPCVSCSGHGQHACPACGGGRVVSCPRCYGHGQLTCSTCHGHKQVVQFLAVARSHEAKEGAAVIPAHDCPEEAVRGLKPTDDFHEVLSRSSLGPPLDFSQAPRPEALDAPIRRLRGEVQAQGGDGWRRVGDRLRISEAQVVRLEYTFGGRDYTAWFSGEDGPVHAPESPVTEVAARQIEDALAAWKEGREKDAIRALRPAVAMARKSPECRVVLEAQSPRIPEDLMRRASAFSLTSWVGGLVGEFRRAWSLQHPAKTAPGEKPAPTEDELQAPRHRLWERSWVILPCLVFFFPVGLPLVWINRSWSRRAKFLWTGVGAAWMLLILLNQAPEDRPDADRLPASQGTGIALMPGGGVTITHDPYTQVSMPSVSPSRVHAPDDRPEPLDEGPGFANLLGHGGSISAVALDDSGTIAASGDESGIVKVWRLPEGKEIASRQVSGAGGRVSALALSPRGDLLFTASDSDRLWRTGGLSPVRVLGDGDGTVADAAFSPDGHSVAAVVMTSFGYESSVRVWEADSGREIASLEGDGTPLRIAFSPDGSLLASGLREGGVRLWDWRGREVVRSLDAHSQAVSDIAFSSDGRQMASVAGDGFCKVWDVRTGQPIQSIEGGGAIIFTAFLPGDEALATVEHNSGTLHVWDITSGKRRSSGRIYPGLLFSQCGVAASGGMVVAGGSADRNLVRAGRADAAPTEQESGPVPVADLAQVNFASGPGGEPIELERAGPGSGYAPFESFFYRDRHGRVVRHGPYVQRGGDGQKSDEVVYIHGARKFGQGWDSEGRLIRSEVYRGDGDHTRVDYAYWDDGGIRSIGRYRIRHTITEAGEKIEAIPHGLCLTYYDNTLVRSGGHLDQLAGLHQAELYEEGELVGIAVYNRGGELVTSRGRGGEITQRLSP